ncbi:MAG TPA: HPF/RaiA family ribosome-associated protein [Candidatus Woesebacteria bacterium]|nr:HPF/RaiA family ribosome-associated protein [Candidatus Woesebacteria bacterium]HPJ17239.1 HPF/RaiA family ribosome-associated protein [Candidatus Woesebacteria bacterium]
MNIQIIGDNFEVSDRSKKLIEEKISQPLDLLLVKFAPEMKTALLHVRKDKLNNFIVNLDMNLPGKEHVFAETSHKIFKSALIDLCQQIERQIKRYKERLSGYN